MRITVEQARKDAIDALDAIASGELNAKERREACEAFVELLRYISMAAVREACEAFVELLRYISMAAVREAIRIAQEYTLTNKQ